LADYAREAAARNSDNAVAVARAQLVGQALSELTVLATLGVGILLVLDGVMDAAALVASMLLIWRVVAPAQEAFSSLVRFRQVRKSVQQLDELMAVPAERASVDIVSPSRFTSAAVAVERLYYRPAIDQEAALNGVAFSAPAGTRTAIVGPNSGGKTLLLECLAGLRQPQAGRVLVNGRDIRQFDPVEYRAWVGYVPQRVSALPMTVRDYMRLRDPALQDEGALLAFERVLGAGWQNLQVFLGMGDGLLDRQLRPLSQDTAEIRLRYIVNFVAATVGAPPLLLLDGAGLGANPWWDSRITAYLDSIRDQTTVIWAAYSTAHIQSCDQMVLLDHGNVRHAGPTTRPAVKVG
jgi:ABC-type bacteriocin/lantibiotic exporter with double-glycine peptidase domain